MESEHADKSLPVFRCSRAEWRGLAWRSGAIRGVWHPKMDALSKRLYQANGIHSIQPAVQVGEGESREGEYGEQEQ